MSDLEIVTHKSLASLMKCSARKGSYLLATTREYYGKPNGSVTLGQVLKANRLEK